MSGQPNLLIIMSDEHAPMYSSLHGHPLVQTPNMERLAALGTTFDNAYCNSPLCMPSRMSFMTGRFIHHQDTWDNACPLRVDALTWAHLLRSAGYEVVLSGKQHFCGPDRLHGFQRQLARDLHAELAHPVFDWSEGVIPARQPWGALAEAGPGRSTEIAVDDLAQQRALDWLRDPARADRPWALNVSFIAPHFPFIVPQRFWDMYPPGRIDMPDIPPGHLESLHPVYQRLRAMFGFVDFEEELVRRARAGYYGLITYLDEKIGQLLDALEASGQLENTVVIHLSDHGEMNGEHGMWRKSNFYEASVRVPLQIAWPGQLPAGQRLPQVVSLVDVVATMLELAGVDVPVSLDGESLAGLLQGQDPDWKDEAFAEYCGHGVVAPMAMLRRGRYKFNYSLGDPPELYDLQGDPGEFHNLAGGTAYAEAEADLQSDLLSHWDPQEIESRVRRSQRERILLESLTDSAWRGGASRPFAPPEWRS
ncbi:MAG: sulfatase-like hydrolase/transferase [Anaerolineaceae bacterium]|nr:sulfatase-like hydrolase/transferase [Anaerolineaceae bacterium]